MMDFCYNAIGIYESNGIDENGACGGNILLECATIAGLVDIALKNLSKFGAMFVRLQGQSRNSM